MCDEGADLDAAAWQWGWHETYAGILLTPVSAVGPGNLMNLSEMVFSSVQRCEDLPERNVMRTK